MHSKHKHKKHKKYKFKILKPVTASDPKISIEIDKLIADFVKYCAIATKQPKENVPEQLLKTLKKVTKKRKTTEHSEKKKKTKNVNTTVSKVNNSNEQRLPLKKRHYHLLSNNDNKTETEDIKVETEDEIKTEKNKLKIEKPKPGNTTPKSESQKSPSTAKYVPVIKANTNVTKVPGINNNEYETKEIKGGKVVGTHIDEAIEACIHRFSNNKTTSTIETPLKEENVTTNNGSITATTPKKRHRLEMANSNCSQKPCPTLKTEIEDATSEEKAKPKISVEFHHRT